MKKVKSVLALLLAFAMLMSFAVTGSAAAADAVAEETENNGTAATATAFGFATKIKGVLGTADDKDYFSFTSDAEGLATVTLAHDEIVDASQDIAYFQVTVYDAAEKEVVSFRSTGAEKETISPSFAITAKATYFVKVEMASVHSDVLEYTIIASFDKNALTEKEPNDQVANATKLELSTSGSSKSYYGTISQNNDVDFYRVAPSKAGVIYLYLYNGNVPSDFKATLYTHYEGVDGILLEEPVASISIDKNQDSAKSVAIGVYGKEYMLKVEGVNGKTGGYRTRVFYQAVTDAEKEYNNEAGLYNEIAVNKALRGTIAQSGDVDFYRFSAANNNAGYKISISLADSTSPKTGSWKVTLTEGKNQNVVNKIEDVEINANNPVVITTEALSTDRNYYIQVEEGSTLTTEIYKISIEAVTASADNNKEEEKDFGTQIKDYANTFWGNFAGWIEDVDFMRIIGDLLPSIGAAMPTLFTWLISLFG